MKPVSISGSLRENVGKKDAKAQRTNGMIPCVLYGGEQQFQFSVDENQLKKMIYTPEVFYAELEIGEKKCNAIIQAAQFHAITDKMLHIDFLEIVDNKPITIGIPIKVTGTSPGILRGGKLSKKVRKLKVKGELQHIPECIELDITPLDINDNIKVGDINIPHITLMDNPAIIVLAVLPTRNVEAAAPGAE